ncbi:helix-turn-helix domain-containing protein [Limimaricola variabilis]|nr:helix-turn-helix domain-containing protein [Limimaricola variabilis]
MIGRSFMRASAAQEVEAKGFDAFELRLGDLMRGERATMGKSLLDVQRELKIKAAYIAAIENSDPTAFDTPGFIAGYVRSYARYLGMDPDTAYETFCRESGFTTAHGMSAAASTVRPRSTKPQSTSLGKDIFSESATPFLPPAERILAGFEPRALGSVAVLLVLMGGLGYGGWSILQEVQKVRLAPVEQTPAIMAQVDPLAGGGRVEAAGSDAAELAALAPAAPDALDRLYRPQALDVPVMTPRDGPIAALVTQPRRPGQDASTQLASATTSTPSMGTSPMLAALDAAPVETPEITLPDIELALLEAGADTPTGEPVVRVTEPPAPGVTMVAVRPAWVRVKSADGSTLYEGIMNAGDEWQVPSLEQAPTLRVGESGAVYFAVNGQHYGPAGDPGTVTSNLALSVDNLTASYQVADLERDSDLAEFVRVAEAASTE